MSQRRPSSLRLLSVQLALAVVASLPLLLQAQTQGNMNRDACAEYKKADQALNATYSRVRKDYAQDPRFLAKLKQAQLAWIAFRDAHLQARFPKADKQTGYGSAYPACRCALLAELTEQRVKQLQIWLDGIPEGDVCNGSVRMAQADHQSKRISLAQTPLRCTNPPGL
jgi:uncharacterized protein YecT (DUF1311 family)